MPAAIRTRSGSTPRHETHHVDTGFIVFNDRNYPNFERLLDRLDVAGQPSSMSFGVSDGIGDFEYTGGSANGLFAKRAHLVTPWFHRMIADLSRFQRNARELLVGDDSGPSLGHWLEQQRFSRPFIERLIVPQASAVWSADPASDVVVSGALPDRVLRQSRDARLSGPPALANRTRRLVPLRGGAPGPIRRTRPASTHRSRASRALPTTCWSRRAALSRADSTRSCSPPTPTRRSRSSATRPRVSTSCCARSPTRPTRRSCTPTSRCCPGAVARGRAGITISPRRRATARPSRIT